MSDLLLQLRLVGLPSTYLQTSVCFVGKGGWRAVNYLGVFAPDYRSYHVDLGKPFEYVRRFHSLVNPTIQLLMTST